MCIRKQTLLGLLVLMLLACTPAICRGQSSSLYGSAGGRTLTLSQTSFTALETLQPKVVGMHDIITVVVQQKSQMLSEGEVQRRKRALLNAQLLDWLQFEGWNIKPGAQLDGDPTIQGIFNHEMRNISELETRDALEFRIACTIVDVRPNGHFVIEGKTLVHNNEEMWEHAVSGIVRPEDILPNNTILSENISQLRIEKCETGSVRDGYRRGWFQKWWDKHQPF